MISIKDVENTFMKEAQVPSEELGIPLISPYVFDTYKTDIDIFIGMIKNQILYKIIIDNIHFGDKDLVDDIIHLYSIFAFVDVHDNAISNGIKNAMLNIILYSEYAGSNVCSNIDKLISINFQISLLKEKSKYFSSETLEKSKEFVEEYISTLLPAILSKDNSRYNDDRIQYVFNLIDICASMVAINQFKYSLLYYEKVGSIDAAEEKDLIKYYENQSKFKHIISSILF